MTNDPVARHKAPAGAARADVHRDHADEIGPQGGATAHANEAADAAIRDVRALVAIDCRPSLGS